MISVQQQFCSLRMRSVKLRKQDAELNWIVKNTRSCISPTAACFPPVNDFMLKSEIPWLRSANFNKRLHNLLYFFYYVETRKQLGFTI